MRTRFARTSWTAPAILLVIAGCAQESSTPRVPPLEPPARSNVEPTQPKVELTRPTPPPPVAEATPAAPPATQPTTPNDLDAMIQALGPLQVISPDDAKQQATKDITPQNADAELQKLRNELGGGG